MATDGVGERLREARLAQGLSLRGVAQSLGVSASLISQVENGKTQPSVATLYALVSHLGISFDELMQPGTTRAPAPDAAPTSTAPLSSSPTVVQRGADNPVLDMENGVHWERLAASTAGPADAMLVTYAPGASSSVEGKLMRHAGIEYGYLLEGELTVQVDFDSYELRAGDSLHFDSVRPHLYVNRGDVPARGLWFVVGRRHDAALPPATHAVAHEERGVASAVDVLRRFDDMSPAG